MEIAIAAALVALLVLASYVVYQRFLHPLANFPGPPLASLSYLSLCIWTLRGRLAHTVRDLHSRYGPVVRVGPNTLSFSSVSAARTIYGQKPLFLKNDMYDAFSSGFKGGPSGLFPERDPDVHAELRRVFTPCFFEGELQRQEPAVQKYVDQLVSRLGEHQLETTGININLWARSFVSDVISDLSFGQAFGSLDTGTQHFWVYPLRTKFIISSMFECCRRYPLMRSVYWYIYGRIGRSEAQKLHSYSAAQMKKRFASLPRADYIDVIYRPDEKTKKIDLQVLRANLYGLIIGATETTSFAITAALYFLASNPGMQSRLFHELQESCKTYDNISLRGMEKLPYLRGVVDEALRILPPSPLGGMRVSPGAIVDKHHVPNGTEVFSSYISASRAGTNFEQPDRFEPDRWAKDDSDDTKGASLAFSLGPRNCIGRPLALMQTRLAIAKIIHTFEISLAENGFDLEKESRHYGGPWITPPVMLMFRPRSIAN